MAAFDSTVKGFFDSLSGIMPFQPESKALGGSKSNIKDAVEKTFSVKVLKVNTLNVKPKAKRDRARRNKLGYKSGMKKAIVTLKAGDSIDLA